LQKEYVRSLFDAIAYRYDLLNHLLSGGVDLYWRRRAVEFLRDIHPPRVLDVATGTGDFAIATLRLQPAHVVGVDIAGAMLERAQAKTQSRKLERQISFALGDAEALPFPDEIFDAAIVAFGARNFEHLARGILEMHRVLRSGGKLVVLEFSRPDIFVFRQVYFFYFRRLLPLIGRMVSRHREAYTYLPESVMGFPEGEEFLGILRKIGFTSTLQKRMTFGIASVYTGVRTD
jgi:demethylmenaquinone methyltransferase/2-methoxy-6-polyprenyl-1,4-benzoquinol methylase